MIETKIYVGLNDSDTMQQEYETERYIGILKEVCRNYHVAFSFSVNQGGFIHEDGRFTDETTLVICLVDAEAETVNEIAKDLCAFFHQESVLITEDEVRSYYVNEQI